MSLEASKYAWQATCPSATAKLVLLAIADHINDLGVAWPATESLAQKCGLSRRAVSIQISLLTECGLLLPQRNPGKVTVYRLGTCERVSQLPENMVPNTWEPGSPVNVVHMGTTFSTHGNDIPITCDPRSQHLRTGFPTPGNGVPTNHKESLNEPVREETLLSSYDSCERGSHVNPVPMSLPDGPILAPEVVAQIEAIVALWPNSRGKTDAERVLAGELRQGISLDEIEAATRAIVEVIDKDYTPADRLRFVPQSNVFFEKRRWREEPQDWRQAKAVIREQAVSGSAGVTNDWSSRTSRVPRESQAQN